MIKKVWKSPDKNIKTNFLIARFFLPDKKFVDAYRERTALDSR